MNKFGVAIVAAFLGLAAPASADTITNFSLNGVTFDDGGTATGGFTLDLTTGTLSNVDITTSFHSLSGTFGIGDHFTDSTNSSFSNSPTAHFGFSDFFFPVVDALDINLPVALTDINLAGLPSFSVSGSEGLFVLILCGTESACFVRNITAGTLDVIATPIPGALPLFAGGLGMLGLLASRRKRRAALAAA